MFKKGPHLPGLSGMEACTVAPSGSPLTLSCIYEGSADYASVKWYSTVKRNEAEITEGVRADEGVNNTHS